MNKTLAVAAVFAATLAPAGTASASDDVQNVQGNGYGNCKHSSAGGNTTRLDIEGRAGNGNGGLYGSDCVVRFQVKPQPPASGGDTGPGSAF